MSRRRQSYRPYVGPTQADLYAQHFGTQARRTDRPQLRLIHAEQGRPDDLALTPFWWLALAAALGLGVALMPLAYAGVLLACWLAGIGR